MTIQSLKWPYEAEIWHISLFLTKELTAEAGGAPLRLSEEEQECA